MNQSVFLISSLIGNQVIFCQSHQENSKFWVPDI